MISIAFPSWAPSQTVSQATAHNAHQRPTSWRDTVHSWLAVRLCNLNACLCLSALEPEDSAGTPALASPCQGTVRPSATKEKNKNMQGPRPILGLCSVLRYDILCTCIYTTKEHGPSLRCLPGGISVPSHLSSKWLLSPLLVSGIPGRHEPHLQDIINSKHAPVRTDCRGLCTCPR